MKSRQYNLTFNESDSWLIALFFKRITFDGVRECAVDKDETYDMIRIIESAMKQLEGQGIAPR
jgi:hypothetical protein